MYPPSQFLFFVSLGILPFARVVNFLSQVEPIVPVHLLRSSALKKLIVDKPEVFWILHHNDSHWFIGLVPCGVRCDLAALCDKGTVYLEPAFTYLLAESHNLTARLDDIVEWFGGMHRGDLVHCIRKIPERFRLFGSPSFCVVLRPSVVLRPCASVPHVTE